MNVTLKLLAFRLWHCEHVSISVPERAFFPDCPLPEYTDSCITHHSSSVYLLAPIQWKHLTHMQRCSTAKFRGKNVSYITYCTMNSIDSTRKKHVFLLTQRVAEEMPWPPSDPFMDGYQVTNQTESVQRAEFFDMTMCLLTLTDTAPCRICVSPVRWEKFLSFEWRMPSLNGLHLYYPRC